jgi:hypothetical protein
MIILMASFTEIRSITECKDSGLVSWRTGFSHNSPRVGFVSDEVVVGMVSLQRAGFSQSVSLSSVLHSHSSIHF